MLGAAAAAGVRVVKLSLHGHATALRRLPAQMAGLTQLAELRIYEARIIGGWSSMPRQLAHLHIECCPLGRVAPADTWARLPRGLQRLRLEYCGLTQVPQLSRLTRLTKLELPYNRHIQGGWGGLPPQLVELSLFDCKQRQLPAQMAGLVRLTKLNLGCNPH